MSLDSRGVLFPKTDEKVKEAEDYDFCIYDIDYPEEGYFYAGLYDTAILDPAFWVALGKALGWKEHDKMMEGKHYCMDFPHYDWQDFDWKFNALRFFELKLTGGDEEKFWEELLK